MSKNSVVENGSTKQGTAKIDVSPQVKAKLVAIRNEDGHTSMDSVIRSLLERREKLTASEWARELRNSGYGLHIAERTEAENDKKQLERGGE